MFQDHLELTYRSALYRYFFRWWHLQFRGSPQSFIFPITSQGTGLKQNGLHIKKKKKKKKKETAPCRGARCRCETWGLWVHALLPSIVSNRLSPGRCGVCMYVSLQTALCVIQIKKGRRKLSPFRREISALLMDVSWFIIHRMCFLCDLEYRTC